MPAFNFKTHASPKLGRGRPEEFQLSPQASRALLGSPESSPSLSRFFARRSPTLPVPGTLGPLRVPLMPEKEVQPALPDLWSSSYVALYAHYACVGMVGGLLTTMLQPYCLYVIEAPPNTCASINTFINLPFGFKLFYGMVSDCVPVWGQVTQTYPIPFPTP